jgi:hypothetical protein
MKSPAQVREGRHLTCKLMISESPLTTSFAHGVWSMAKSCGRKTTGIRLGASRFTANAVMKERTAAPY